jgi:hypothetical protein
MEGFSALELAFPNWVAFIGARPNVVKHAGAAPFRYLTTL